MTALSAAQSHECRVQSEECRVQSAECGVQGKQCRVHVTDLKGLCAHVHLTESHSFQLSSGRAANPGEILGGKAGTQHLTQHRWEAGVARIIRKEVRALPMRQPCIRYSTLVQCATSQVVSEFLPAAIPHNT